MATRLRENRVYAWEISLFMDVTLQERELGGSMGKDTQAFLRTVCSQTIVACVATLAVWGVRRRFSTCYAGGDTFGFFVFFVRVLRRQSVAADLQELFTG